jgi:16S rRNA processing protein RimM
VAAAWDASSASDAVFPADAVEVGRILDAWGVKGWIRVQALSKDPQALFSSRRWFLRAPDSSPAARRSGAGPTAALPMLLRISQVRSQGDDVLAAVHGIDERNAAEALRGARIFVSRGSFPSTAEDEFYWVDLIGLDVSNREGLHLGRVVGLLDTGVHSVLRIAADAVDSGDAAELLVPFVAAYVDEVDMAARRIRVDWQPDYA